MEVTTRFTMGAACLLHRAGRTEDWSEKTRSNVPFCLFLTLAKLFNRAPSTGANGWRLTVAMMMERRGGLCRCGMEVCVAGAVSAFRHQGSAGKPNSLSKADAKVRRVLPERGRALAVVLVAARLFSGREEK
jgi:hypothetical protein